MIRMDGESDLIMMIHTHTHTHTHTHIYMVAPGVVVPP